MLPAQWDKSTFGMALVEGLAHALTIEASMGIAMGQVQLPLHDLIPQAQLLGLHLAHCNALQAIRF